MSRAGRKRKTGSRQPNGQPARDGSRDRGTPEFQAHRAMLVGPDHIHDGRAGDKLGVLELAGLITASEREAATTWAHAMWAVYGKPRASGGSMEPRIPGHGEGPGAHVEAIAKAGRDVLKGVGHHAYHFARMVAVEDRLPGWYRRDHVRTGDIRQVSEFLEGLRALDREMPAGRLD